MGLIGTMRATIPVGDKGRVTIPKAIRDELEIESGDVVEIEVMDCEG